MSLGVGQQPARAKRGTLRRDLRASVADAVAFGGMVGFGETYIPAFALAIGLGEFVSALAGSIPLVAGGIIQLVSPVAVRMVKSHRTWVVLCSLIQSLSFTPLALAAYWGEISSVLLLVIAAMYWGAGLATGPAWNTWIGTIVRPAVRPKFFAHRTRLSQAAVLFGVLTGGLSLQYASTLGASLTAFAVLFVIACGCRLFSTGMLALQSEPVPMPTNMRHIPWRRVFHHLRASSGGRLLVYLVAVQASAQIAGPFFTPFMLKQLELSYGELVTLLSIAFLAKVVALSLWGRVAKRMGARQLLWIGGVGIVPVSAFWIFSQSIAWLGFTQLISGIVWAAYELAFFLLFFESIPEDERTSVLTIYNLLNTTAFVIGVAIGSAVLYQFDFGYQGYLWVFALSSVGRLLTVALLARVPYLVVEGGRVGVRTMAVRPGSASVDSPVLPSLPDREHQLE